MSDSRRLFLKGLGTAAALAAGRSDPASAMDPVVRGGGPSMKLSLAALLLSEVHDGLQARAGGGPGGLDDHG